MFDGQARRKSESQFGVSGAQRGFGFGESGGASEDEAEVACAFGPGGDVVFQASRDANFRDARHPLGFGDSFDAFENSAARHGNHHHAGSIFLAFEIEST